MWNISEICFIFSDDGLNIEKKLRVEDFRLLRHRFNRSTAESVDISAKMIDKRASMKNFILLMLIYIIHFLGSLNKEEFIDAFESILDPSQYRQLLEKLFDKVFFLI
jgi:hypothetical protein